MERDIEKFLAALASSAPVPGGGGAAALAGALGIALGNMVGELTLGKKKYAGVQADMAALNERAAALRGGFLALIDADAAAFEPLSRAYGIPKDDPARAGVMEAALSRAAGPPLELLRLCAEALDVIAEYAAKGSALAVSDAGSAAALAGAVAKAAALNVFINTRAMAAREAADRLNAEANRLLTRCEIAAGEIYDGVYGRLADG